MSQQAAPSAADSPALVVTTSVQKYAIKKKEILNPEESELYELSQAAGITVDQEVFKILVDLLKMNVAPQAVFQTLKAMCAGQRVAESCGGDSVTASHGAGITTTKADARDESSGKSAKVPAGVSTGPGPRATRVSAKMAAYGSQDVGSAPHAQDLVTPGISGKYWLCPSCVNHVREFGIRIRRDRKMAIEVCRKNVIGLCRRGSSLRDLAATAVFFGQDVMDEARSIMSWSPPTAHKLPPRINRPY
ncbi:mitotic-spindle organizing protein 2 isoform X2 [Syngnathus typhle]|uniref:mitotic-spindle organizing protein 2 isoform X2 n=1 Tax=Syngnathus typhle TaxID=161592 RepID=UPI002A6A6DE7|nr:mitotic-spindle organizing protein 2 isoform X2 [Syngnathus typhle]